MCRFVEEDLLERSVFVLLCVESSIGEDAARVLDDDRFGWTGSCAAFSTEIAPSSVCKPFFREEDLAGFDDARFEGAIGSGSSSSTSTFDSPRSKSMAGSSKV